jgi:hypothetical protein
MLQQYIFSKVIFLDWHGVISQDPFWVSILTTKTHPLCIKLEQKLVNIFGNQEILLEWMQGLCSSEDIINKMGIKLDCRYRNDFLQRRLISDCFKMNINVDILNALCKFCPDAIFVLATDNMDCFIKAFRKMKERKHKFDNKNCFGFASRFFDDIICSSEVGFLKAKNPEAFFGPWLSDHCKTFADALLIDDRADNCNAFRQMGGAAIQWGIRKNKIDDLVKKLKI